MTSLVSGKSTVSVKSSIPEPHSGDRVTIDWAWQPALANGTQFKIVVRDYGFVYDSDILVVSKSI